MVWLTSLSLSITVDALFQIFDTLFSFVLIDTLLTDHQVC